MIWAGRLRLYLPETIVSTLQSAPGEATYRKSWEVELLDRSETYAEAGVALLYRNEAYTVFWEISWPAGTMEPWCIFKMQQF